MVSIKELKAELKKKTDVDSDSYYPTAVLIEKKFKRKQCSKCGMFFWSQGIDDFCGEPECSGNYKFIGNPIGKKMNFIDVWKSFSKFFMERGYTPIKRYPVAARWRDDTDFVQASIYDFQPHVVSGSVKPPANPLVVPQYCLRFNEIENVGITGRHNTGFVMIGQHAFTSSKDFEQDKYFRDLFDWFVEEIKIPENELKIHESQWGGGGNLGVSMEFFARGLELGNQVYMLYKIQGDSYIPLNLKVLDMGMGQGRVSWLVNGTDTMYEAEYPGVCGKLFDLTNIYPDEIFKKFVPYASVLDVDVSNEEQLNKMWSDISFKMHINEDNLKKSVLPVAAIYSIADHCQSLLFALSDGVLPSNIGGGYNLRAILRRSLSFIDEYDWDISLGEVCEWLATEWKKQYPELMDSLDNVKKILAYEEKKYKATLEKSKNKIYSIIQKTNEIDFKELLKLYESDGITPELIKDVAKKEGIEIKLPKDFYSKISGMHETSVLKKEIKEFDIKDLSATERMYHENIMEFKAYVKKDWVEDGSHLIILDRTAFYPESGGQDCDTGFIDNMPVKKVFKQANIIIHEVEGMKKFTRGSMVTCKINTERRKQLMMHHTATHIINGACQKVLGKHIWQAGAEKKEDRARLDITHYDLPTEKEIEDIEKYSNKVIEENRPIIKETLERTEAEQKYGFRLYQGGAVPSNMIRVVEIKNWDVEACGGTHADNTFEIEQIKILKVKKIQDGIIRLEFVAGKSKIKETMKNIETEEKEKKMQLAEKIIDINSNIDLKNKTIEELDEIYRNELKNQRKNIKSAAETLELNESIVYLENTDFKTMQEAGRKKVRENPNSFIIVISNGFVFGAKGKDSDIDVQRIVEKACEVLGGKCGSKNNEYTGGGPLKEKSKEAYEKAREML